MKLRNKVVMLLMSAVMALSPVAGNVVYAANDTEVSAGITQDNAANIALGKSYIATFTDATEEEWFTFTTPDCKAYYTLETKNFGIAEWTTDIKFCDWVLSEQGETMWHQWTNRDSDVLTNSFVLEPNTRYYLKFTRGYVGSYRFSITYQEDTVGDTKEQASEIKINNQITSSIDGIDDADYYSFVASDNDKYIITGKNLSIDNRLMYQVYSRYDEVLAEGFANKGESINLNLANLEKGETYYIKAICYSTGNYNLKVSPARISLKDAGAVVTVKSSVKYNGKAQKPSVTVKVNNVKLKKGVDYTVSYSNNKKVGKATIKVKGIGKYTGTITKSFKIVK